MKRWLRLLRPVHGSKPDVRGAGYTMTEVMIVLAVTTALFVMIAIAFQGRQARVEFTQAVRNYEARLQNVISDVTKGYYQSSGFACSAGMSGPPSINSSAPQDPGTNSGCIFLGKVVASHEASGDVLTVIGRRLVGAAGSPDVRNLEEARPLAVHDSVTNVDITELLNHSYGLQVRKVLRLGDQTTTNVAAFGFMNQLAGGVSSDAQGSRSVLLYGITDTMVATPTDTAAALIQNNGLVRLNDGILICLRGANGQRAEVTIGANNSQTAFTTVLDTENSGACSEG